MKTQKPDKQVPKNVEGANGDRVLLQLYTTMLRIRRFEEKVVELLPGSEIKCPVHLCIGQEAIAAGVCANLRNEDPVFSTHRSHGHYIAKGGELKPLMAEIFGRETGCSKGRGGSMHLVATDVGFPGSCGIVGGAIPLAVGAALAFAIRDQDSVAVPFLGDGAVDEGAFYESLNFAALKKLPVVFVCENNFYATHLHTRDRQPVDDIPGRARCFSMPAIQVDGNDVLSVLQTSHEAIEKARGGGGPSLIECRTYRWRGHVGLNFDLECRDKEELERWMKHCPIAHFEEMLLKKGILSESDRERITKDIDNEVAASVQFARDSGFPDASELTTDVFRN